VTKARSSTIEMDVNRRRALFAAAACAVMLIAKVPLFVPWPAPIIKTPWRVVQNAGVHGQ
jgi:hypothetical protein